MTSHPRSWTGEDAGLSLKGWLRRFGLHPGGSWALSWVALFTGFALLASLPHRPFVLLAVAVLSALFSGLTVVGALAFAGVRSPLWILPAVVGLGAARWGLWYGVAPEAAHGLALLYEPTAAAVAAVVVFRASLVEGSPATRWALSLALGAVACLELADAMAGATGRSAPPLQAWWVVAPATALLELGAMWLWIARRELRLEQTEAAHRLLEDKEAWLFDFFEKAPDMLLTLRPETCEIERCNRRFSETLGYARREVVGRTLFDFIHPGRLRRVRPVLEGSEWRRLRNLELRLLRRDGAALDVLANFALRPAPAGGPSELRAVLHDVTRLRLHGDEPLPDDSIDFAVAQAAPAGIFQADVDGHCDYVNPSFSEITGLTAERAGEHGLFACLHPEDDGPVRAVLAHAARNGTTVRVRHRVVPRPGTEHLVLTECTPLHDDEGRATGLVGSMVLLEGPGVVLDHDVRPTELRARSRRTVPTPTP